MMYIPCLRDCEHVVVSYTRLRFQEHALPLCSGVSGVMIDVDIFHMTEGTFDRQRVYTLTQSAGR